MFMDDKILLIIAIPYQGPLIALVAIIGACPEYDYVHRP